MINFKALGNIFHVDSKKMDIIKAHKENFQTAYDGVKILSLLDEAELNNDSILTKIEEINEKEEEITKNKELIKEDETEKLSNEIKNIKLEINTLNIEKDRELKTYSRLKTSKEEILPLIKQELAKINISLED